MWNAQEGRQRQHGPEMYDRRCDKGVQTPDRRGHTRICGQCDDDECQTGESCRRRASDNVEVAPIREQ